MKLKTVASEALQSCLIELGLQTSSICLRNTDDNRLWSFVTTTQESVKAQKFVGSGVDFLPCQALIKSIAESIERYFIYSPNNKLFNNLLKKEMNCMSTEMWPTFIDEQLCNPKFKYKKFCTDDVKYWVAMQNISTENKLLIPASLIWLSPFNDRFSPGISSGTACHFDKKQALLSSIYEIIERDAFSIFWESQTVPPFVVIDSVPFSNDIQYLIQKLIDKQFAIKIIDVTTEFNIPVYCVIIFSNLGVKPNICVGAACNLDRLSAISKAFIEAYQTWSWMCEEVVKNNLSFSDCLAKLRDPSDMMLHPLLYTFQEARKYCDFVLNGLQQYNEYIDENNIMTTEDKLNTVLNILNTFDFQAHYLDIGNNITQNYSVSVTRVIIPGLVPLSIGLYGKHHANPRIKKIPQIKNWRGYENIVLNSNPHPFP